MKAPQRKMDNRARVLCAFLGIVFVISISGARTDVPVSLAASEDTQNQETSDAFRENVEEVARDRLKRGTKKWGYALQSLSAHPPSGWLLCLVMGLLGLALLGFGGRLIRKTFVPIVTLIGVGAGGYLGLQLSILTLDFPSATTQVIALSCGTIIGGGLFLFSALEARPIAWMFLVATPFIMISAMIATVNPIAATISGIGGGILAILTCLRHRVLAAVSTSMLGAFSLAFSWGLLMHLVKNDKYRALFVSVVEYPFILTLIIVVLIIVGVDLQLLFSGGDE